MTVPPDGTVLVEAGHFEERLQTATINVVEATQRIALRAVSDETVLREWMKAGVELVEGSERVE